MRIFFSLLLTLGLATPALAQGKVRLVNDSLHLVYFDPSSYGTNAGQAYVLGAFGQTLTIELWSGTSSTALSRVAVTDFTGQPGPGVWNGMNVTLPTAAGPTFFQIDIYDVAAGSYAVASTTLGHLCTTSGIFTAMASGTIAYNSLVNHNSPALSTFADGTWNMDYLAPGYRGALDFREIPEPSTCVLGCLGFGLLLLHHRTKTTRMQKLN